MSAVSDELVSYEEWREHWKARLPPLSEESRANVRAMLRTLPAAPPEPPSCAGQERRASGRSRAAKAATTA